MTVLSRLHQVKSSFENYKNVTSINEENRRYGELISNLDATGILPILENLVHGIIVVDTQTEVDNTLVVLREQQQVFESLGLQILNVSGDLANIRKGLDSINGKIHECHTRAHTRFEGLEERELKLNQIFDHDALSIPVDELTEKGRELRDEVLQIKNVHDRFVKCHQELLPTNEVIFGEHKELAIKLLNLCIELAQEKEGDKTQEKIDAYFMQIESEGLPVKEFMNLLKLLKDNNRVEEITKLHQYKVVT